MVAAIVLPGSIGRALEIDRIEQPSLDQAATPQQFDRLWHLFVEQALKKAARAALGPALADERREVGRKRRACDSTIAATFDRIPGRNGKTEFKDGLRQERCNLGWRAIPRIEFNALLRAGEHRDIGLFAGQHAARCRKPRMAIARIERRLPGLDRQAAEIQAKRVRIPPVPQSPPAMRPHGRERRAG